MKGRRTGTKMPKTGSLPRKLPTREEANSRPHLPGPTPAPRAPGQADAGASAGSPADVHHSCPKSPGSGQGPPLLRAALAVVGPELACEMPKETAVTFEQQRGGRGYRVHETAVPGTGVFLRFLRYPKPLPLSAPWKRHQRPLLDGRVFGLNSLHLAPPALGPTTLCLGRRVSSQGKAVEHKTLAFQPRHPFPALPFLRVSPSSHRCQTQSYASCLLPDLACSVELSFTKAQNLHYKDYLV